MLRWAIPLAIPMLFAVSACERSRDSAAIQPEPSGSHPQKLLASQDPIPAEIIERALIAQQPAGVSDKWGWHAKIRGAFQGPKGRVESSGDAWQEGTQRLRMEIQAPAQLQSLYVDDGQAAWERGANGVRAVGEAQRADVRRDAYVDWVSALWPLRGPGYRLASLGRSEVRGVSTLGVRVSRDGEPDVDLYFDTTTWLKAKRGYHRETPQHEAAYHETFYSEWRTANGVHYASRVETLRNGKPLALWDLDVSFTDGLPDELFRKPSGT